MMKRLSLILLAVTSLLVAGIVVSPVQTVLADNPKEAVCEGINSVTESGCETDISLNEVVSNIINLFSVIIGVVAVIMIIVAGFKYITAAGDSNSVTSAKHTLVYAIIGLVIVGLSQAIVRFVLQNIN